VRGASAGIGGGGGAGGSSGGGGGGDSGEGDESNRVSTHKVALVAVGTVAAAFSGEKKGSVSEKEAGISIWAPLVESVARLLLPLSFAVFGFFFVKSSLADGLVSAIKFSDVFATAFLAFVGWAFTQYLESVNRRFDAIDLALRELRQSWLLTKLKLCDNTRVTTIFTKPSYCVVVSPSLCHRCTRARVARALPSEAAVCCTLVGVLNAAAVRPARGVAAARVRWAYSLRAR